MHHQQPRSTHAETLSGLYAITDAQQRDHRQLLRDVEQALLGGARIIQFREKGQDPQQRQATALALRALTHQYQALFIVNDDPQLAASIQADGVHLGQDDADIKTARNLLGNEAIIGVSCYNRFELAEQACMGGADYVAFGRFFPSGTKPTAVPADIDLLRHAKQALSLPIVAIGGITQENARILINAGADMLAVVGGVFDQPDIAKSAQQIQRLFDL